MYLDKTCDSRTRDLEGRSGLSFSRVMRKWINNSADGLSGQVGLGSGMEGKEEELSKCLDLKRKLGY